ncbi:BMP-binding endothelial regulator protein [Orchesella cincta]|uniref:BMP-binding endothelial regulator protein n=1 Tax=Orchesella cincta TaxID=48709 RepID=A0A1D2MKA4_ORCCI|nr:BMP-binding endothelial regulator protein [Orchesella cincta]
MPIQSPTNKKTTRDEVNIRLAKGLNGCKVGNMTYSSGTETIEDCVKTTCTAGVLTRSQIHCYTPCSHPVPPKPGQCCPTCDSCSLNGREYRHGEEAILPEDPCVRCKCTRRFPHLYQACLPRPRLSSFGNLPGKRGVLPKVQRKSDKICAKKDKVYPTETTFRLDTCTNCTCVNNTAVCDRLSCPPLECEPIYQIMVQGACCPKCAEPEPVSPRTQCVWKDEVYKNGERWDVNSCRSCICDYGKIRCTEQMCPKNLPCPWGYKLKYIPGKCCPECVGEDGVCTVFGDPHYRTFDGRVFNFQGACKYVLTSDCKGKSFAVRVRNDARESRAFSWTRTVTLKVREGRVTLGQKMRIKVNGKRVALPYNHGTLSITQDGYTASVETGVGVKLLWDGDSFLEVTVPHALKGRLCGLCGNFNGNKSDDFMTRRGGPVNHPNEFGQSWRVGGKKACTRQEDGKKRKTLFSCSQSDLPRSCTTDMCECPVGRKCHCEVFTAYARACQRSGIELGDWREVTGCSHKKKWRT